MKLKLFFTNLLITVLCFAVLAGAFAFSSAKQKDLDSLEVLTAEVKATADKAATAEALANAVAELNAVKITANAAATKEALSAAEAALKALVASGDEGNQTAITLLQTAIDELKSGKADASALANTKAELKSEIEENLALLLEVKGTVETVMETYVKGETFEQTRVRLETLINENKEAIGTIERTFASLDDLDTQVKSLTELIESNDTAIDDVRTRVEAIEADNATDTELAAVKQDLTDKIEGVKGNVATLADGLEELKGIAASKEELNKAVNDLNNAADVMKADLEAKITKLRADLTGLINDKTKKNADDIATLQSDLNALSGRMESLTDRVSNNETAISDLQTAVGAISKLQGDTEVVRAIMKIQSDLGKCATAENLEKVENDLKALIALVGTKDGNENGSVWASLNSALADIAAVKSDNEDLTKVE